MVIWQGFGFLALVLPIFGYVLAAMIVRAIAGAAYLTLHSWPGALGTLAGAAAVWLFAAKLNSPGRELLDPKTGQTIVLRKKHTHFFIPIQYVAIAMAVVGVGILLLQHESTV